MSRTVTTTSLLIKPVVDEQTFAQRGRIVRYAVPPHFRYLPERFERLYSELRDKLAHPYYFYSYDAPSPGLYVLYPPDVEVEALSLKFMNEAVLPWVSMPATEVPEFHILIKLLQAAYFQSRHDAVAMRGGYYIVAKAGKNKRYLKCLQITLKGGRGANEDTPEQEIKVIDSVTTFKQWEKEGLPYDRAPFFGRTSPKGGQSLLRPLKMSEIEHWDGDIYVHAPHKNRRTTLAYHDTVRPHETRGYLLYQFIHNFIAHLGRYGIQARSKQRQFNRFHTLPSEQTRLPLGTMGTVYLLDNRLNQETVPFTDYRRQLEENLGHELGVTFEVISVDALTPERPILVIQDVRKEDFESGKVLEHHLDPYQTLYSNPAFRSIPKQSINVNLDASGEDAQEYLDYECVWDKRQAMRFRVALNELFLKWLVLQPVSAWNKLPYLGHDTTPAGQPPLAQYAFLRKKTERGIGWRTLLYLTEEKEVRVADLRNPVERQEYYALLERLGLDEEADILAPLQARRYQNSEDKIKRYDFLLGPGQVIEIVNTDEDILYDYDQIEERADERQQEHPISDFKLAGHYARLRSRRDPSLEQLRSSQLRLWEEIDPAAGSLLARLQAFDALLENEAAHRPTISFNQLTSGELGEQVADILGVPRRPGKKPHRGRLLGYYQTLGKFLSAKGRDILDIYEGIWFDDELCYMVGAHQSINQEQAVSHLLRRFDVYRGATQFNIEQWLGTMHVPFVRPERHTVYPYFFHLLDIYVDIRLSHGDISLDALGTADKGADE